MLFAKEDKICFQRFLLGGLKCYYIMSSLYQKQEWIVGSTRVHQFYQAVADLFIQKVYKDNRYRSNSIDEITIDQLEHKIKLNLCRPRFLFESSLSMRQGSCVEIDKLQKEQFQRLLKLQASPQPYKSTNTKCKQNLKEQQEQEIYIDDLQEYNCQKEESNVKEQDQPSLQISNVYDLKYEQDNSSYSDSSPPISSDYYQSKTNSIIYGTFESSQIKRKPKSEQILLKLSNCFIKWSMGELFLDQIPVQISKIEKSTIHMKLEPAKLQA